MKLPDFYNFQPLNELRRRMGLQDCEYGNVVIAVAAARLTADELDSLASEDGLVVSIDQVDVLDDSTLSFKGSRVLLYIRDHTFFADRGEGRRVDPKFHIANCETLRSMKQKKRFERYVVSSRVDGHFNINIIESQRSRKELMKLSVCKNCLNELKYNGYGLSVKKKDRRAIVESFQIEKFFEVYPRSLHTDVPIYTSDSAPLNDYDQDFSTISNAWRERAEWTCQEPRCGRSLKAHGLRKYLHLHHINGIKADSRESNLKVLCIACHAEQPSHGHMKALPAYAEFLSLLRRGMIR